MSVPQNPRNPEDGSYGIQVKAIWWISGLRTGVIGCIGSKMLDTGLQRSYPRREVSLERVKEDVGMEGSDQQRAMDEFVQNVRDCRLTRNQLLKRAAAAGFAATALPAVLAACGSSSSSSTTAVTGGGKAPAKPGGTMKVALPAGVASTLDPQAPSSLQARLRNWNVFDALFVFANDGKLEPALAEEATSNPTATEWTFRLRSGVVWQDGSPFTADDVVYSLQRILDPKTAAEGAGSITMIDPKKIKKVDATTVRVGLKYPFSILPAQMTYYCPIIKAGTKSFNTLNGTGPFKFQGGNNSNYTLVRNPNYWKSGLPHLDRVEVVSIQDDTARLDALKTGQVDAIYPTDFTESASVASEPSITTFVNKAGTFMPMYMTSNQQPFSDNRVRQALKFAADRQTMNQLAYGGEGKIGNDVICLPTDPGYPKGLPQREFDPEKAKSLWNAAGMEGKSVQFYTANVWPGMETAAIAYSQKAKEAGINVEVKKVPDDQFESKVYGVQPFSDDYWYYTPILTIMSQALVPGAAYYSTTEWSTPETTKLYKEAAAQTDETKRNGLEAEIMRRIHDEGPYIVWGFEASPDLYTSRIGGQENSVVRSLNGFRLSKFYVTS
ncbi:MAG: ABC transporter substrate-binding protein [Actinobacteria bacterium]|nr:ABC transporter substrate-binding protein [Actinomycetota bacterium]